MSRWGGTRLVMRREVTEGLRRRSFRVSVAVQVLVVLAIVVISSLTSDGADEYDVGTVGPEAAAVVEQAQATQAAFDLEITAKALDSDAEARDQVESSDVDAAVSGGTLLETASTSPQLTGVLQEASRAVRGQNELERSGLGPGEVKKALSPPALEQVTVGGETADDEAIAFIANLLLYLVILFSSYAVAAALIEEKASRVIELVLPAVRPGEIMNGKLVGMGILGVVQVAAVAIAGVGAALALGEIELPSTTGATVALLVAYFVAGYAFFAALFGAGAALVANPDDLQSATSPGLIVAVASYIVSIQAVQDPHSALAEVLTLLPPTAPMVAPSRAAQDALPLWQLGLSLVFLALATAAALFLARTLYERAILRTGKPMALGEALRLGR